MEGATGAADTASPPLPCVPTERATWAGTGSAAAGQRDVP
jgi:hypothetical protein